MRLFGGSLDSVKFPHGRGQCQGRICGCRNDSDFSCARSHAEETMKRAAYDGFKIANPKSNVDGRVPASAMNAQLRAAFLLLLLAVVPLSVVAHNREWRTATFLGFNSAQSGTATMPVGTATVTVPLRTRNYWFRTDELDYCLYFPSRLSGRVPNLTINGTTKIAIDGRHVYVRDDDGKEWKCSIITKVAH
jgi:hypothetical protein